MDERVWLIILPSRANLCNVLIKLTEAIESGGVAPPTEGLSHKDEWEIPRNQISLIREIGSGQFGCVFEGTWNNAHQVAVKQLKKGMMDSSDFLREAKIMKDLRHPNLIQLYAVGIGYYS